MISRVAFEILAGNSGNRENRGLNSQHHFRQTPLGVMPTDLKRKFRFIGPFGGLDDAAGNAKAANR
jgi:hypothetical protein